MVKIQEHGRHTQMQKDKNFWIVNCYNTLKWSYLMTFDF